MSSIQEKHEEYLPRMSRESVDFVADAGGGNRTHTLLRELDFESSASASSATPAIQWDELYAKNHAMKSDRQAADRQAARASGPVTVSAAQRRLG